VSLPVFIMIIQGVTLVSYSGTAAVSHRKKHLLAHIVTGAMLRAQ